MKRLFLLGLSLFALTAQAQYFNHHYGTSGRETVERGSNTIYGHEGFVISGLKTDTTTVQLIVARSDKGGNITAAPDFKKYYRIRLKDGTLTNAKDAKVIELSDKRFAVAGTTVSTAHNAAQYIYYLQLDSTGTPLRIVLFSDSAFSAYKLNGITLSSSGNELYFTGYAVVTATKDLQPFIAKLKYDGTIVWLHVYDIDNEKIDSDIPNAIVENPDSNEVVVVGNSNYTNTDDGFIFRVDASTGAPIEWRIYGTTNTSDLFTAIRRSKDSASNFGYVIGGYTTNSPGNDFDAWMIRIDDSWSTLWSDLYDYNAAKKNNRFDDVAERLNTSGSYEYYGAGAANSGVFGANDMEVDKINSSGAAIAQFSYGTSNGDRAASIDQNDYGVSGLSLFGQTSIGKLGSGDLNIYKTYYNGVTSCNYRIDTVLESRGPDFMDRFEPLITDTLYSDTASIVVGTALDSVDCSDSSIYNGSNRIAVSPENPTIRIAGTAAQDQYLVSFGSPEATEAVIAIYDLSGRLLQSRSVQLSSGTTEEQITVAPLPAGMYLIRATAGEQQTVKKILLVR